MNDGRAVVSGRVGAVERHFDKGFGPGMRHGLAPATMLACGVAVLLLLAQAVYWCVQVRPFYFPNGDEYSLLVHSTTVFHANPAEWVRRGFADYFIAYPDLSVPSTDFLRPVDNFFFYVASFVAGRHWAAYLFINYLASAALAGVAVYLAAGPLRLRRWAVALVLIATLTSPAYNYQFVYRPSFAFDYLAAVWSLLCLACLTGRRWRAAWVFAALAVFTKETGFYAPVAAFLVAGCFGPSRPAARRWAYSALYLLPLPIMYVLRLSAFRHVAGVYVLNGTSPGGLLRKLVIGLTNWPYRVPVEQHIFEPSAQNLGSLLLVAVLWGLIGYTAYRLWMTRDQSDFSTDSLPPGAVLFFLLGSCAIPALLMLPARFGPSTFALTALLLALLLNRGPAEGARWPVWTAGAAMAGIIICNVSVLPATFGRQVRSEQRTNWAIARDLIAKLRTDGYAQHYLVNDVVEGTAAPGDVQRFAEAAGTVNPVIGVQQGGCGVPPQIAKTSSDGGVTLDLSGRCTTYYLISTNRPDGQDGRTVYRQLPEAEMLYSSPTASVLPGTYGWKSVRIELRPTQPSYVVYAPDLASGREVAIASGTIAAK